MWLDDDRRAARAFLVATALLVSGLGLTGCAKQDPPPGTATTAGGILGSAPNPSATPVASPTASAGAVVLADGRHPVFVTGLSVAGKTITFDLIQFLTGEPAKQAWAKEHPGDPDGPPNDFFIVNDNPKLRTLAVSATVTVKVVDTTSPSLLTPSTFASLPAYFAQEPGGVEGRLWHAPFWLKVAGGVVIDIEEQYLP